MLRAVKHIVLLAALALVPVQLHAEWLPAKTNRLVNDYSGILDEGQRSQLERRLVAFNDSTSNQILIVVTPTLDGDDENAAAQRIGERWGVGQAEFDNGVVILVKSKTADEDWGAVAIATGYGAEGALPDVFCKHIIDDRMLGPLSEGDYYGALVAALDIIEPVMAGEYSYAQYRKDERTAGLVALGVFVAVMAVIVVLVIVSAKKHPEQWHGGGTGGTGGFFYGGGSGHSWGGGSGFGGGFGGFGGFGGGSFGGGGASGRF